MPSAARERPGCSACTLRSTRNDNNARNKKPKTKNQKRIEELTGKVAPALPGDPKDRKLAIKQRSKLLQGHDAAKRRAEYQRVCKVELRQAERLQQSAARDLQRGDEEGAKESTDTAMRVLEMAAKQKNCAQANFDLYTIYKNGTDGLQPDLEKASQYLDAAAKSNFAEALLVKAQALEDAGDWKGAFAIYSDIAKNGCRCCTTVKCGHNQPVIAAQSKLVEMNEREALDLPPDGNMLEWIQKAAEAGDKKAKLRLAVALEGGHFGLAKDLRGALKIHLELAAGDIPLCEYTGKPEVSWDYCRYGFREFIIERGAHEIAIPLSACKNELTWTRLIAPYRRDDWRFTLDDLNIQYEISPTLLTNQLNGQFFFSGIDIKLGVLLVRHVVLVNQKKNTAELAIMAHSGLGCSQWRVSSAMIRDDLGHSGESCRTLDETLPRIMFLAAKKSGHSCPHCNESQLLVEDYFSDEKVASRLVAAERRRLLCSSEAECEQFCVSPEFTEMKRLGFSVLNHEVSGVKTVLDAREWVGAVEQPHLTAWDTLSGYEEPRNELQLQPPFTAREYFGEDFEECCEGQDDITATLKLPAVTWSLCTKADFQECRALGFNYMLPAFSSLVSVRRGTYERWKREGGGRSRRFARFGHKFIATRAN